MCHLDRAGAALWVAAACLLTTRVAHAERLLELTPVKSGDVRVDGALGEWRGVRFASLGDDEGASLEYAIAFEDGDKPAIYVGARVSDDEFVRSARPGPKEDAVVLSLAMPRRAGRFVTTHVWLFAGEIGKSPASASVSVDGAAPRANKRVRVVEGPRADGTAGYVIEARIPLELIESGRELQIGRGALRMHDVDRASASAKHIASAQGAAAALPPLNLGANAALHSFLRSKSLGASSVRHDLIGDVYGDQRLERVVLAETFAVIVGPDVQGGQGFHYVDLPVTRASGVRCASLRDLTADGKRELLLTLRQSDSQGSRDLLQVMDLSAQQVRTRFTLEVRKQTSEGEVEAKLRIADSKPGRAPAIKVSIGEARGLSAQNYRASATSGVESILLPWGKLASRTYRWDGARFAVQEETDNAAYVQPAPTQVSEGRKDAAPRRVTHQKPPGTDQLVAAFRRARGIDPAETPRFVRHVNLAEDERVESLMLFGKHLLVVGRGFRGGSGFFYFELPVDAASDIQRLFTGDVTGDGRREIFVRFKQTLDGPDGDPVQREILLGYSFAGEVMQPIVAVEVRRAQGESSVGNVVKLVRDRKHWALVISPGRARGWSGDSYPFVAESMDAYQRLLLPWRDRTARYRFDGSALSLR